MMIELRVVDGFDCINTVEVIAVVEPMESICIMKSIKPLTKDLVRSLGMSDDMETY